MKTSDRHALACKTCHARHTGLCRPLDNHEEALLAKRLAHQVQLVKGEHIYHEGEITNWLFSLTSGWVLLYHQMRDGNRQGLELLLPGAFLGLLPAPGSPMTHSAVCLTEVRLCSGQADALFDLMREQPEIAIRALRICARDRIHLHELIVDIARRPAMERVARFLIELHLREEFEPDHLANTWLPLSQQDIGDLLGLTVVHTNRVMRRLRDAKAIESRRGGLRILDLRDLSRLAGLDWKKPAQG